MHNLTLPEIRIQQCQYSAIWITPDDDDDTKVAATVINYFVLSFLFMKPSIINLVPPDGNCSTKSFVNQSSRKNAPRSHFEMLLHGQEFCCNSFEQTNGQMQSILSLQSNTPHLTVSPYFCSGIIIIPSPRLTVPCLYQQPLKCLKMCSSASSY